MAKSSSKRLVMLSFFFDSAVCLRQGHDNLTSMRHYQGLVFSDDELRDIKKKLTAWGIVK